MDEAYLHSMKNKFSNIITIEEGTVVGGFGDGIAGWLLENGYSGQFQKLGLPDSFIEHGTRDQILSMLELDSSGIAANVQKLVNYKKETILS